MTDPDVIDTGEGNAGEAKELDPETAAARAEAFGRESRRELDERQERLRTTRRSGGPDLDAETEASEDEDVPDIEPTEPEEEPGPEPAA
jgi:hypothetical protein